jgi:hypothetical protein
VGGSRARPPVRGRPRPARRRAALSRGRIRALARAFDRAAGTTSWGREERRLKARLARRRSRGRLRLTRAELCWIGEWKTPRIRPRIARNTEEGVRGLTEAAFLVGDDAGRMRLLLGLSGVGLAVASVILHFAEPSRHPVWDVRVRAALARLGAGRFPPTPAGWAAYAERLRGLARRRRVTLRTLDKALWQLGRLRAAMSR